MALKALRRLMCYGPSYSCRVHVIAICACIPRADNETNLSELIGRFREEDSVPAEPLLSICCGGDNLSVEWLASNHEYCAKDIESEIHLVWHAGQHRRFFVGWRNAEVFSVPSQRRSDVLVAVLYWWTCCKASHLLYVQSPPAFAYHGGIYKACSNDADRALMIAGTENVVMNLACFLWLAVTVSRVTRSGTRSWTFITVLPLFRCRRLSRLIRTLLANMRLFVKPALIPF